MRPVPLGRVAGIDIRLHPSFFLLPLFFGAWHARAYGAPAGLRAAVLVLLVFACVLFHECVHALTARRHGIRTPQIVLYPFGGVACLSRIPREPAKEFEIAVAGPLSNFALAAALLVPAAFWPGLDRLDSPSLGSWEGTFVNAYWINLILGLFNLIPAFPMDGGRILRSLLARRFSYLDATRISALCGRVFAILFFLTAVAWRQVMLGLIGAFVFVSAGSELAQVRHAEARRAGPANEEIQ